MSDIKKKTITSSAVAAKAGLWYTFCNFLFRGMGFLTTPIFTRLLTKAEIGVFSGFSSWVNILIVLTAFDLHTSIIRSKLEHEEDMDSYIWSILSLSATATVVLYGIVCIWHNFFVSLFQVEMKYIHLMFMYLLVSPAYQMLVTKQRAYFKYKTFVALTGITMVAATLVSLLLVLFMEDRLAGRMFGFYIPQIAISTVLFCYLAWKGKYVKIQYWKYACIICLPLVPHLLSMTLLNSSDKILLSYFHGEEYTAIYSIAYYCYHIAIILFDSMNKAWAPWLLENLHGEKYTQIRKISKIYVGIFAGLIVAMLLVVPEIIYILGGRDYMDAVYCLPPLIASCMIQFVYTMYVNIEFYKKKTFGVAGATIIATLVNLGLDFFLIPRFQENSHVIAAYTTLVGFAVLFVLHYYLVKRMKMAHVYDIWFNVGVLALVVVISLLMNLLYTTYFLRYVLVLLYGSVFLYFAYKNKTQILNLLKKKR